MGFRCAKTRNWGTLCEAPALYRHGYRDRYTLHVSRNTGAQETGGEAVPNENLAANIWAETSVGIADLASVLTATFAQSSWHCSGIKRRREEVITCWLRQGMSTKRLSIRHSQLLLPVCMYSPQAWRSRLVGCVCTCTHTLQVPRRCTRGRPMQAHVQSTRCMCSICTESLVHLTYMHVRNRDLISLPHDSCSSKSSGSRNRYVPLPCPRLRIHGRFSGRVLCGASLRDPSITKDADFWNPLDGVFSGGLWMWMQRFVLPRHVSRGAEEAKFSAAEAFFFGQSFLCPRRSISTYL